MELPRVFASRRGFRRTVLYVLVLLAVWVCLALVVRQYVPGLTNPRQLREYVLAFGPLAPVAFVFIQAAQVVVAPIPGQVVALAGGYLFGTVHGTVYSVLGATIGSWVAFSLARRYGREYVERVVDGTFLDRFDAATEEWGLLSLFVAFLLPGLPDDAICFVAGVTTLDMRKMVAVALLGRLPAYFLTNVAGEQLANGQFGLALLVIGALLGASALGYYRREAILRRLRGGDDSPDDDGEPESDPEGDSHPDTGR